MVYDFVVGHANIELVTFDKLNPHTVEKLIQERQRIEYGNLKSRHPLLHQIDRSQWPVLFAIARLQGTLPDDYTRDNPERFAALRTVLRSQEE